MGSSARIPGIKPVRTDTEANWAIMQLMSVCSACGEEIPIGGWPFCPHNSVYPEYAQHFTPLLFDRDPLTGKISYVGDSSDPVPAGYVRESLTTLPQIDRFCRARSEEETAERRENIRAEKDFWDNRAKERREFINAEMARRGYRGRGLEVIRRFVDARREANYDRLLRREINFFSDVGSYDASNREPHSSERTGWRQRKG